MLTQIKNNKIIFNLHEGQLKAWDSKRRFVFILAGTQAGKTEFAVPWLLREIKQCGNGDYLVVSPSYPLQQKKVVTTCLDILKYKMNLGDYRVGDRIFELNRKGFNSKIFFGSADNPDSLESCTAKAAHLDEVGQKSFKLLSWEAILRRLSINQGRCLGTTTIYNLGWIKNEIYDRWKNKDKDIDIIQFPSIMNPVFPKEEYERAKNTLPLWKFNMFYRGEYDKPAGLIYNSFDERVCIIKPIALNPLWPRHVGIDFGGVHTAALWYAEHKVNDEITNYYLYREYLAGERTAKTHAQILLELSEGENVVNWVGGSWSEDQWRIEFSQFGIPIKKPIIKDVEIGIDRVYAVHKENRIFVFDICKSYYDEKMTYSRKLDEAGQPTEDIEDKNSFHFMDSERYIIGFLEGNNIPAAIGLRNPEPLLKRKRW